ncbi:MAG: iron-binding protein [Epsilonproteobacteria bacterium]|nr:iron-binding protein [Campylobacterota bacterium]NPA63630.1 iron-binding protein [Campylobacterota bacterium]
MLDLLRKKHALWLVIFFGSMSLPQSRERDKLLDFANIQYRHLKWIAKEIVKSGQDFDWNRDSIKLSFSHSRELFEALLERLRQIGSGYPRGALFDRIRHDEEYMIWSLEHFELDVALEAFSKKLTYEGLDQKSLEALVRFLFEEIYKEYELILTYTYSQLHTDSARLGLIFEDLIYESMFHLKSFCTIAAKLGILSVPRVVMEEVYKFDDLKKFLEDGIAEELAAKEQCKALSSAIKNEELSRFFAFINYQEDYHITLMQEALEAMNDRLT